ncbi:hypothetical protein [Halorubellus litoreus]|uniref:Transcriptional regulator PadR-like family protein n=1 Tax=Halorubellus litoreus TaxID=755308 RepID=A0ABD5VIP0_9EURY
MTNHTPPTDQTHTHTTDNEQNERDANRFDTLSGFQRAILRALDATHPQASETATSIREMLRSYSHYDADEPSSSRFYPTKLCLEDRNWVCIQHGLEDARRRHYHLTRPAIQVLTAITAVELGHNTTTQPDTTTADAGGDAG